MVFWWRGLQFFELKQNILDENSNKTTLQCSKAWDPSSRGIWVALELWKFLENILEKPSHAPTNMDNTSFWSSQKLNNVCKFLWESCLIATGTKIRSSLLCWAARGWWPVTSGHSLNKLNNFASVAVAGLLQDHGGFRQKMYLWFFPHFSSI